MAVVRFIGRATPFPPAGYAFASRQTPGSRPARTSELFATRSRPDGDEPFSAGTVACGGELLARCRLDGGTYMRLIDSEYMLDNS